jgi:hypothetical protein
MLPIFVFALSVLGFPAFAAAYLDPGNGSYLFQIILGIVLTSVISLRTFWGRAKDFLRHRFQGRNKVGPDK